MIKCFSVSSLILLCLALIETTILSNFTFLPAVPDLVLMAGIFVAMINGRGVGVIVGFISGFILDFITGCPFGYNCLLRTLICYCAGFFAGSINLNGIVFPLVIGMIGTFLKVFLTWIISFFYPNTVINYTVISMSFLVELVLNSLLCPVIFKLVGCFEKQISCGGDF